MQAQDPAPPGAAVEVHDGSSVYGSDGKPVGKVVASRDDAVLIDTGAHRIPVAAAALAEGQNGATLPLTRAALDAQYEKTMAQQAARVDAALTVGAPVKTADAKSLGTVKPGARGQRDAAGRRREFGAAEEVFRDGQRVDR